MRLKYRRGKVRPPEPTRPAGHSAHDGWRLGAQVVRDQTKVPSRGVHPADRLALPRFLCSRSWCRQRRQFSKTFLSRAVRVVGVFTFIGWRCFILGEYVFQKTRNDISYFVIKSFRRGVPRSSWVLQFYVAFYRYTWIKKRTTWGDL